MEIIRRMFKKILFIVSLLNCCDCFAMDDVVDVDTQREGILSLLSEAASSLMDYAEEIEAVKVFTAEEINIFLNAQAYLCSPAYGVDDRDKQTIFELGKILADSEVANAISAAQERRRLSKK
jgi:hypothetical protein